MNNKYAFSSEKKKKLFSIHFVEGNWMLENKRERNCVLNSACCCDGEEEEEEEEKGALSASTLHFVVNIHQLCQNQTHQASD